MTDTGRKTRLFRLLEEDEPALTIAESDRALVSVCRSAGAIVDARGPQVLDLQEPLPASSIAILRRLPRA